MTDRNDRRPVERRAGESVRIIGVEEAERMPDPVGAQPPVFPPPPPPRPVPLSSDQARWAPEGEPSLFGDGRAVAAPDLARPGEAARAERVEPVMPAEAAPPGGRPVWGPPLPGDDGHAFGAAAIGHGAAAGGAVWPEPQDVSEGPGLSMGHTAEEVDDTADTEAFAYAGPGTRAAELRDIEGVAAVPAARRRPDRDHWDDAATGAEWRGAGDKRALWGAPQSERTGTGDLRPDEVYVSDDEEPSEEQPAASLDNPEEVPLNDAPAPGPRTGPRRRPSRARVGQEGEGATSALADTGATAVVGRRSMRRREAGAGDRRPGDRRRPGRKEHPESQEPPPRRRRLGRAPDRCVRRRAEGPRRPRRRRGAPLRH